MLALFAPPLATKRPYSVDAKPSILATPSGPTSIFLARPLWLWSTLSVKVLFCSGPMRNGLAVRSWPCQSL